MVTQIQAESCMTTLLSQSDVGRLKMILPGFTFTLHGQQTLSNLGCFQSLNTNTVKCQVDMIKN